VFTREDGAPLHYSVVLAEFQALLAGLGLPRKRFYDLRHQCASFLIAEGAELRDVMEQLGHSQISLTANTYGHLYDERKRELAALMDGKLRRLTSS
jgi:integrase